MISFVFEYYLYSLDRESYPITHSPSGNKRFHDEVNQSDTSDDEEIQSKKTSIEEDSLELGNDQMDYKQSTIPKHHQRYGKMFVGGREIVCLFFRRKYPAETNPTSTRPILRRSTRSSTMKSTPTLRDDSQTNEDLLNKI